MNPDSIRFLEIALIEEKKKEYEEYEKMKRQQRLKKARRR